VIVAHANAEAVQIGVEENPVGDRLALLVFAAVERECRNGLLV
jgi:hypothetical protein